MHNASECAVIQKTKIPTVGVATTLERGNPNSECDAVVSWPTYQNEAAQ